MRKYFLLAGWVLGTVVLNAQNARLVAQKSGKGAVLLHEVQAKEGLYTLSRVYSIKVAEIATANGLDANSLLQIGQKIQIPLSSENLSKKKGEIPVYYAASEGETMTAISNRFSKVPVKELKNWNNLNGDAVPKDKEVIVGYFLGLVSTNASSVEKSDNNKLNKSTAKPISEGVIQGTNINIRKGPATDNDIVGTAQQGDVVEVIKTIGKEWVAVRTKEGVEGYVSSQFIQKTTAEQTTLKPTKTRLAVVSGTNINVRKSPTTNAEVVEILQQGNMIDVIKTINEEWVSVRSQSGEVGYVASRFLVIGNAKISSEKNTAKSTPTAKAYATKINIRKGPSTEQEVIALAQPDEVLIYVRKVDDEWSEVRNAEGNTGFVATRFLSFDGAPSAAAVEAEKKAKAQAESLVAQAAKREVESQNTPVVVAEKNESSAGVAVENTAGFFKSEFEKREHPDPLSEQVVLSSIFKTDRGWKDGKYYLLMDQVAAGTIVKLTNPSNNQSVYAKVLGKMKGTQYAEGLDIRISEAAAQKLQIQSAEKFNIKVLH